MDTNNVYGWVIQLTSQIMRREAWEKMSAIYDNWERLVAAVLKKEQLWQLFHDHSRSPTILSEDSSFSSSTNSGSSDLGSSSRLQKEEEDASLIRDAKQTSVVWDQEAGRYVSFPVAATEARERPSLPAPVSNPNPATSTQDKRPPILPQEKSAVRQSDELARLEATEKEKEYLVGAKSRGLKFKRTPSRFEKKNQALHQANLKLTQDLVSYQFNMSDLQRRLSTVLSEKDQTVEELNKARKEIEQLKQQSQKLQSQIFSIMEENNLLKETYESSKKDLRIMILHLETMILRLEEQSKEQKSNDDDLKAEVEILDSEVGRKAQELSSDTSRSQVKTNGTSPVLNLNFILCVALVSFIFGIILRKRYPLSIVCYFGLVRKLAFV